MLPKLKSEDEFELDSRPTLLTPDGRIMVDAYGFYKVYRHLILLTLQYYKGIAYNLEILNKF